MPQAPYHCPRWAELPDIPLYLDQLIMVVQNALAPFAADEPLVTKTMVNNYVKQKLMPPPEGKKYGRKQLALLIVISLLKRVFSLSEIQSLTLSVGGAYGMEEAYNLFCERLESMLADARSQKGLHIRLEAGPEAQALLDIAVAALVSKLVVQVLLADVAPEEMKEKD